MPRKSRKQMAGEDEFVALLDGLVAVPKAELDREVAKYEKRKAAKKAKTAKVKRPSRRGQ